GLVAAARDANLSVLRELQRIARVGAGQSPGEGIGNGRATVLRFAQEGAKILAVDRDLVSANKRRNDKDRSAGQACPLASDLPRQSKGGRCKCISTLGDPDDQGYHTGQVVLYKLSLGNQWRQGRRVAEAGTEQDDPQQH